MEELRKINKDFNPKIDNWSLFSAIAAGAPANAKDTRSLNYT
jgi:hypothetical protein